ncbi:MAG: hypothetical protein J6I47_05475 [Ruminococcus sp.]|nr:hypothetical protein [Ruminococcus sp.]
MKKLKKVTAILAAASTLLSMTAAMGISAVAESTDTNQLKIDHDEFARKYTQAKDNLTSISKFDYNNNGFLDYEDYNTIRDDINKLYANADFRDEEFQLSDVSIEYGKSYDFDCDNKLTYYDYCCYLVYLQTKYQLKVIYGKDKKDKDIPGTNLAEGEITAAITNFTTNESETFLPTEVYYKERIVPVSSVNYGALKNCNNLRTLNIKNYSQPYWYKKLEKFDTKKEIIPTAGTVTASSFININDGAFVNCPELEKINFPVNSNFTNKAFNGTKFAKNVKEINGVYYAVSSDNKAVAVCGVSDTNAAKHTAADGKTTISFEGDATIKPTTITANAGYALDTIDCEFSLAIPETVKYIHAADQSYMFRKNTKLKWVNGMTYNQLGGDLKELATKSNSAFVNTEFITDPVKEIVIAKANEFNSKYKTDREKVSAVCEYIFQKADYTNFDYLSGSGLFPNGDYNTLDYSRDNIYAAANTFLTDHTECMSYAMAVSIMLDSLNIPNFFTGTDSHAYNHVFLGSRWYRIDMSGYSDYNRDLNKYKEIDGSDFFKESIGTNSTVGANFQFALFKDTNTTQLTDRAFRMTILDDASKITVFVPKAITPPSKFDPWFYDVRVIDIKPNETKSETVGNHNFAIISDKNYNLDLCFKGSKTAESYNGSYYDEYGRRYKNFVYEKDGNLYALDAEGKKAVNTVFELNGKKYRVDSEGKLQHKGWLRTNGKTYYFKEDGTPAKDEYLTINVDGKDTVFSFDGDCSVTNGWYRYDSNLAIYSTDSGLLKGWQTIDGSTYFFRYHYAISAPATVADEIINYNGSYYYFADGGKLVTDSDVTWNGQTFHADLDGKLNIAEVLTDPYLFYNYTRNIAVC